MKSSIVVIIYYFDLISKFGLMGNRMHPRFPMIALGYSRLQLEYFSVTGIHRK